MCRVEKDRPLRHERLNEPCAIHFVAASRVELLEAVLILREHELVQGCLVLRTLDAHDDGVPFRVLAIKENLLLINRPLKMCRFEDIPLASEPMPPHDADAHEVGHLGQSSRWVDSHFDIQHLKVRQFLVGVCVHPFAFEHARLVVNCLIHVLLRERSYPDTFVEHALVVGITVADALELFEWPPDSLPVLNRSAKNAPVSIVELQYFSFGMNDCTDDFDSPLIFIERRDNHLVYPVVILLPTQD